MKYLMNLEKILGAESPYATRTNEVRLESTLRDQSLWNKMTRTSHGWFREYLMNLEKILGAGNPYATKTNEVRLGST